MNLLRLHRVPLIVALLLPLLAPAASEPDLLARRHAAAMAAYDAAQWDRAFPALVALADAGHRPAARLALLMAARGAALYGQPFEASALQRQRWAALQVPAIAVDFFDPPQRLALR